MAEVAPEQHIAAKIDGSAIAQQVQNELKIEIQELKAKTGDIPKLVVILVGDRKDSESYVKKKTKACEDVGIGSVQINLPAQTQQVELLATIEKLNADPSVNGILVQLPLPDHIDADTIIAAIDPSKDVDGLHEINVGKLCLLGTEAPLAPCTPLGCIALLDRSGVQIEGKRAVVIGRSRLVGKPVAMLLLSRNATVTICHSRSQGLREIVREADIVIAAVGKPNFVKGDWIKQGAVVIDVGINAVDDASKKAGFRLVGDVEFAEAQKMAKAITPVPGGVGPMTVAMLLSNTVKSFTISRKVNNTNKRKLE